MARTGARKNKDIESKEVEIKYDAGLPVALLKDLAKFGVTPRIGFDKTEMRDTGSLRLNWIMGGGIPVNRVTTLAGREKTGKSTTGIIISASETLRGGHVAYFDTENKFSYQWAESLGIDLSLFHLFSIRTGEQLINAVPRMIKEKDPRTGKPFFSGYVIDSVRGTMWDAEDQADAEAQQMGVSGKMWGKFARKVGTDIQLSNAWWLVINGLYDSMKPGSHEEIEPGGKGVPYMSSLRLRTQPLIYGEDNVEIAIRVRCIHSQVGRNSKREGQYTIQYINDRAIVNPLPDLVDLAAEYSVVNLGGGGWYSLQDKKWHGSPALQLDMQNDPELYDYIYDNVMLKIDPNYVAPEKTYEELLGEDHGDMPFDTNDEPVVDEETGEVLSVNQDMYLRQDLEAAGKSEEEVDEAIANMWDIITEDENGEG